MVDLSSQPGNGRRRKGIYLLPNLLTTGSLFAGFYAIMAASRGDFERAALAIFIAMVLDGLDGRVARMTNTQSDFGKEYDSLSDMFVFGVAPALIVHGWALHVITGQAWILANIGWVVAFIYTACAALRLARFNTMAGNESDEDKAYFHGLPSPTAAALVMGMIWAATDAGIDGATVALPALFLTLLAGVLMVSNVRFRSFKELNLHGKVSFLFMFGIVATFALIATDPPKMLFAAALIYTSVGLITATVHFVQRFTNK